MRLFEITAKEHMIDKGCLGRIRFFHQIVLIVCKLFDITMLNHLNNLLYKLPVSKHAL